MTTALRTYLALLAEGIPRADAERAITYAGADIDRALEWLRRNTRLSAPISGTVPAGPVKENA